MGRQEDLQGYNANADNKKYKFFIVTEGSSVQINFAPDGWKDEIVIKRSEKYKGLFRKYSTNELKFPKDGRDTLKDIYESSGIGASSELLVYKWDNGAFEYVLRFTGKFDFSTYKIDELFVSIQIMDNALAEQVRNRENLEVNLLSNETVDGASLNTISTDFTEFAFPNTKISTRAEYSADNYDFSSIAVPIGTVYTRVQMFLQFSQIDEAENQTKQTADFFYRTAPSNRTMKFTGAMKGTVSIENITGAWSFQVVVRNTAGTIKGTLYDSGSIPIGTQEVDFEFAGIETSWFSLLSGQNLRCEFVITAPWDASSGDWDVEVETSTFLLEDEQVDLPKQGCVGWQYYEAFYRILQKITGLYFPFYSEKFGRTDSTGHAYAEDGELGIVTKGQLIRGLEQSIDVNFPITFEDMFQAMDAVFNIGMNIEDVGGELKVRIEGMDYFFDENIVLDLSSRISEDEIGKEVLPDWHYAQVKTGYKKFENEINNALFEYNAKQTYATIISSLAPLNNTLDIICKFRADTNGISVLREQFGTDESEDVKGDDETFIVDTIRDGSDFLARTDEGFSLIDGNVAGSEGFNYRYTPKRNMKRHGMIIRAGLEKHLNSYLTFQATDRQIDLSTQFTGEHAPTVEMTDKQVITLSNPIWWPEAYTIKSPFFTQDLELLDANPNGIIKLSDTKYGWVLEIKTDIDDTAELKLLRVNLDYVIPIPGYAYSLTVGDNVIYAGYSTIPPATGSLSPTAYGGDTITILASGVLVDRFAIKFVGGQLPAVTNISVDIEGFTAPFTCTWDAGSGVYIAPVDATLTAYLQSESGNHLGVNITSL